MVRKRVYVMTVVKYGPCTREYANETVSRFVRRTTTSNRALNKQMAGISDIRVESLFDVEYESYLGRDPSLGFCLTLHVTSADRASADYVAGILLWDLRGVVPSVLMGSYTVDDDDGDVNAADEGGVLDA